MSALPAELACPLGAGADPAPPPPEPVVEEPVVTAHGESAVGRLIQQFKGKPNIEALVRALAARTQGLADVFAQLATQRGINTAVGAQLDNLGAKVGQPRNGLDDETYRIWIRARIRLNLCSGTIDEISSVFALILSTVGGNAFLLETQYPAALVLRISDQLSADAAHFARILQQAKAAGVRALLEWREAPEVETFQCQDAVALATVTTLTANAAAGDTVFDVASTTGLPSSGYLVIDSNEATEETLPFEVAGPTQLLAQVAFFQAHASGAQVAIAPANGCGSLTDPTAGGCLADAREG